MLNSTQAIRSPSNRTELTRDQGGEKSELVDHLKQYASENPTTAALWCLGIGFFLGWKRRIW